MMKNTIRDRQKWLDVMQETVRELQKNYLTWFDSHKKYSFIDYNVPRTKIYRKKKKTIVGGYFNFAKDSFKSLWYKINGETSWKENPWVFVYKFDRLEGVSEGFLPQKNTKD